MSGRALLARRNCGAFIADPLRAMLAVLLKANGMKADEITRYLEGELKEQVIPCLGVTSRYAQISLGTEWGRVLINPDLWANTWGKGMEEGESVMNDSVRFPNEEDVIRSLGGFTILIVRPGTKPVKFKWGWICEMLYDWFGVMWGAHDSERTDRLKPTSRSTTIRASSRCTPTSTRPWLTGKRRGGLCRRSSAKVYGAAAVALSQI
jgi:hypothetical protein